MAAFDFPNSPSTNQTYTANGMTFIWNGSVWKKDASAGVKGAKGDAIKGDKGQKGEQGDKGNKGDKGDKGQKGEIGPEGGSGGVGDKGNQGDKGEKGDKGTQGDIVAATFNVTNNGASNYIIDGQNNPTLKLVRGFRYNFNVNVSGHPFWIKTSQSTGTGNGASGVTNNGAQTGTIIFEVPLNAPATLYYICQYHGSMVGTINVVDNGEKGNKGDKGQKGEDNSTKGQKGDIGADNSTKGDKGQKGEDNSTKGDKGQKGEDNSTKGQKGDDNSTKGQKGEDNSTKGQKGEEGDKGQKGEDNSTKGQKGQQGADNSTKGQKGDDNSTKGQKGQKGQQGADNSTKGQKGQQGDAIKGQKGQTGADNSTKGQKGQKGQQGADNSTKGQKGESGIMTVNARTSGYSAVASDNGKLITMTTGDLSILSGVFSAGDAISVANISNSQFNILQGSGTTLYLSGTTQTGNRVLAAKGLCSIICVSSNTFFVSGGGIT